MALNRYSKLPKATIRNTQVLTDLGIIDTALQRKQAKYDAQASFQNQAIQGAEALPVFGEHDTAYKNKIAEDLKSKALELSNMDLADPNVSSGMNQYIQTMGADPKLNKAVQAKAMYDEFQKSRTDLAAKGKLPTSAEQLKQLAWNEYSKTGELSEDAVNPLYENQNLIQGRGELVNNIKSSSHEGTALMSGRGYGVKSGGVSYEKIGKAVRDQLDAYKNSPYGRQEKDDFRLGQRNGSIPQNVKFEDYLLKSVLSTANTYQHSNTSADYSSVINTLDDRAYAEKKAKEKEEKDTYAGEGYTPAMGINEDVQIDSDNKYDQPWYMDAYDWTTNSDSRTKEENALVERLKTAKEQSGYKGELKDYVRDVVNTDPNIKVKYFSADEAAKKSKQFFDGKTQGGTFINTRVWDEDNKGWIPFNEYTEEKGITKEELENGFTLTGELAPDNPLTHKGFQAVVGGRSVILDNSASRSKNPLDDVTAHFTHEAAKARYNPEGVHVFDYRDPVDKKTYTVTSRRDANGELMEPEYKLKSK